MLNSLAVATGAEAHAVRCLLIVILWVERELSPMTELVKMMPLFSPMVQPVKMMAMFSVAERASHPPLAFVAVLIVCASVVLVVLVGPKSGTTMLSRVFLFVVYARFCSHPTFAVPTLVSDSLLALLLYDVAAALIFLRYHVVVTIGKPLFLPSRATGLQ